MNFTFAGMRWIGAGLLVLVVAGVGVAQQGFPLRPGDWESTTKSEGSGEPTIVHFCLNNETWIKALTRNFPPAQFDNSPLHPKASATPWIAQ